VSSVTVAVRHREILARTRLKSTFAAGVCSTALAAMPSRTPPAAGSSVTRLAKSLV
jgi:hypothetical protein